MLRRLFFLLILSLAPALAGAAEAQETAPDPLAGNKALVRRYIEEILSANRVEKLEEFLTPDFIDHTPGAETGELGPDVVREAQKRIRTIFPTVEYRVEDLVAEGDKVVARYIVRAATKEAEGTSPQRVEITGMTIYRVVNGKIRETWIINDQVELYRQLGFTLQPPENKTPAPAAPPASDQPAGRR